MTMRRKLGILIRMTWILKSTMGIGAQVLMPKEDGKSLVREGGCEEHGKVVSEVGFQVAQ